MFRFFFLFVELIYCDRIGWSRLGKVKIGNLSIDCWIEGGMCLYVGSRENFNSVGSVKYMEKMIIDNSVICRKLLIRCGGGYIMY